VRPSGCLQVSESKREAVATTNLYDRDIHAWTKQTAELLRQHRFDELDLDHLVEELESMGRRDRQELVSRLKVLLAHLLKWQHQPEHQCSSWRGSILEQRLRIRDLLNDCPSLKPFLAEAARLAFPDAAKLASQETGLPAEQLPPAQPFELESLLDDDWLP